MLQFILIGGAAVAAVFLSGCTDHEEKPQEQPDASDPPANAEDPSTAVSDSAPPPAISLDFDEKLQAFQVYQKLKEAGVKDEDLDQGAPEIDYSQPGPNQTIVGKEDRKIQEREVYAFLADHHEQYGKILEGFTGSPDPLVLDDQDPKTEFDEKIRRKINDARSEIQAALKAQGLDEKSAEYKEKMAVALFYFVDFPEKQDVIKRKGKELREKTKELTEIGLASFQESLFKTGGLGVSEFKGDSSKEGSALSSLNNKKGGITEKAKILYAVFSAAGLKPQFVRTRMTDVETALDAKKFKIPPSNRADYNLTVSVNLGEKTRTFDPNFPNSKAEYPSAYPLQLVQFFAGELNQQGFDQVMEAGALMAAGGKTKPEEIRNKHDAALNFFGLANRLDPNNPFPHMNMGQLFFIQGMALAQQAKGSAKDSEAVKTAEKALSAAATAFLEGEKRDPKITTAQMNLGDLYMSAGKPDEAAKAFQRAAEIDPKNALAFRNLSAILMIKDKKEAALKVAKKAASLDPQNAEFSYNLGKIYAVMEKSDEAIKALQRAIRLDPSLLAAYEPLYNELERAGKYSEALDVKDQFEKQAKKMGLKK